VSVKLSARERVSSIFSTVLALLVVLFMLYWFSDVVPKIVSNIGKLIAQSDSLFGVFQKNYQLFVLVFTMFVICMGVSRWFGKRLWYKEKVSWRKELKLPVASLLSLGSSDSSSFTYSSLFQGGFIALGLVSFLLLSVLVFPEADEDPLQVLPWTMSFPILGVALISLYQFAENVGGHFAMLIHSIKLSIRSVFLIIFTVTSGLAEIALLLKLKTAFPVQILIFTIICLCYSYTIGMREGLEAADPELTYPLVSVEVIQGTSFGEAWLYERTDSDYRIVTKSGSNHIIPASNVKEIKGL